MDTFIPRYRYKFKDELPHGDKRYILILFNKTIASEFKSYRSFHSLMLLYSNALVLLSTQLNFSFSYHPVSP